MPADEPDKSQLKYKRVLLKLSGEALMGPGQFGIDIPTCVTFAQAIAAARAAGAEICLVIGGGNIFRGVAGAAKGMERAQADSMGMLATVMNGIALQQKLDEGKIACRLFSAVPMPSICETFSQRAAQTAFDAGEVVLFAGGIGSPFLTTDTTAAMRGAEMGCDAIFKATQVDGVYSADPKKDRQAVRYDRLTYDDVLRHGLQVMDTAAIALARDNRIPVIVFSILQPGALVDILKGKGRATVVATA